MRQLLVSTTLLISIVFSFTLDCDFRRECCWRSAEGEGVWETRKTISTNEFRRTFLVGKNGPYVMRVETGAQEGGSSFMSCPFCSTSPVIVRYRHWQSPTAQVSLCWQLVVGQETQEEDQEECIQISPNEQSNLAQQTLFVPTGKQIQLYFLIENVASKTYGVILIDRISVEYNDCKTAPSLPSINLGAQHTAVVPVHRSSSSDFRKARPKAILPNSGNRKLKINKLTMQESALNEEVARQIRNLENTQDKDLRVSSGNSGEKHFDTLSTTTSDRKPAQQKPSSSSQISSTHLVPRLSTAIKSQTFKNPTMKSTKHVKIPQSFHEAANRVTVMENTQRVAPSMATSGMRGRMGQTMQPPPPRAIPSALPPPPLLPTSLGKDFNPLHDLVGKEFSDFLDPSFISKDDEEGDDPEAEEYFRQQKQKPQQPAPPSTSVRQPARSRTSQPTSRTVMQPQRVTQQQQVPPQTPIRPATSSNRSPLHPLFDRNQCDSPGGCLFERGLCSYTHATLDPNQMFRLTKVGLSSFALANVRPSSVVVLETPTNLREEHLIVLDVLEHHSDVSLRGCCQVIGQPQLICPFSTPIESSVMIWQAVRFSCPANTVKLVFMCENRGMIDVLFALFFFESTFGFVFFAANLAKRTRGLIKRGNKYGKKTRSLFGVGKVVNMAKKFRKFIKHNPTIPRLRPESSLAAKPKDKNYDPCKERQMCMNGGTCINRNGNFECKCEKGYIGKRCELKVSLENCRDNLCQHQANLSPRRTTCWISFPIKQQGKKHPGDTINSQNYMKEISYRCDCLDGYSGDLCEMTSNDLYCMTDGCFNNGEGEWNVTSGKEKDCICHCNQGFDGKQCEFVNPCFANDTCHFGICKANKKIELGTDGREVITYEPGCDCGTKFPFTGVEVTGTTCSELSMESKESKFQSVIPGLLPRADFPHSPQSWTTWLENVKLHRNEMNLSLTDIETLEGLPLTCKTPKLGSIKGGDPDVVPEEWDDCSALLEGKFCLQNASHEPFIMEMPSGTKILAPHCSCDDLQGDYEGNFCQYKRENPCHPTFEEFERGITLENRCTSTINGVCSSTVRKGEAVCICNPGYTGTKCEKFDPCAEMLCPPNSECVPLDPDSNRPEAASLRLYQCVCAKGIRQSNNFDCQAGNGTNKCADRTLCTHGTCFDCGKKAPEGNLEMCDDHELVVQYKCFCEPGWSGFNCDHEISVCSKSQCQNGAICRQTEDYDYDCICRPGTRGTFCEYVEDYCVAFGNERCVNGKCEENDAFSRKFKCECVYGFGGLDCDVEIAMWTLLANFWEDYEPWCVGCSSAALLVLFLICHYLFLLADHEVSTKIEVLKAGKSKGEENRDILKVNP
ncbi:unnamed protein product, partial [Mesorhabditis belari]|uniref:EGF-like domain-containing protein n=1 Tax=Mesorhabditis belari TaxID=2138241 RepID=A0AAF3F6C8_9BILA